MSDRDAYDAWIEAIKIAADLAAQGKSAQDVVNALVAAHPVEPKPS